MTETPQESTDYIAIATSIVRRVTGARWTWPPMQVRDLFDVPPGTRFLQLRGEPLIDVTSVRDYATSKDIGFTRMGSNRIELAAGACRRRTRVDVVYTYGARPSTLVENAIRVLAREMELADSDDKACRLPERVTSVTRQGVSWTVIDPMDFIEKGRTGIIEVDMAINAASAGRAKARPRVFSNEYPPPERLSAVQLPNGLATTHTLAIRAGERLWRRFRYEEAGVPLDFANQSWRAQVRRAESVTSALILDLTPYITLDPADSRALILSVPQSVTAELDATSTDAAWDLFVWTTGAPEGARPLIQGAVTIDPATTDVRDIA